MVLVVITKGDFGLTQNQPQCTMLYYNILLQLLPNISKLCEQTQAGMTIHVEGKDNRCNSYIHCTARVTPSTFTQYAQLCELWNTYAKAFILIPGQRASATILAVTDNIYH